VNKGEKQAERSYKQLKDKRWRDIESQVQRKVERKSGRMEIRKECRRKNENVKRNKK
jgi:hypothetical protein